MAGRRNPAHRVKLAERRRRRLRELILSEWHKMVEETLQEKWDAYGETLRIFEERPALKAVE